MIGAPPVVRPRAVPQGGCIGVAAPAGPFPLDAFDAGRARIEALGYTTRAPEDIFQKEGYLAGPDRQRVRTVNELLADKNVDAVISARGGYGAMRILSDVQTDLLTRRPRFVIGFSDITALLLDIHRRTGLVTLHGPVVTSLSKADPETVDHLAALLRGEHPFPLKLAPGRVFNPGRAAGPLWGGNLTMLIHLLAAGCLPDPQGCVLFFEDVNEAPYRIDRVLTTLTDAGFLGRAAGLVFGEFVNCGDLGEIDEAIARCVENLGIPAAGGLPIGHGTRNLALPIGPEAVFDTRAGTLEIPEPFIEA